jgi:hypothetical protein
MDLHESPPESNPYVQAGPALNQRDLSRLELAGGLCFPRVLPQKVLLSSRILGKIEPRIPCLREGSHVSQLQIVLSQSALQAGQLR